MVEKWVIDNLAVPALYDMVKIGSGAIWKEIKKRRNKGKLDSEEKEVYEIIEAVCRIELGEEALVDRIAPTCELLFKVWLDKRYFPVNDVKNAIGRLHINYEMTDAQRWKKELEQKIAENETLSHLILPHISEQVGLLISENKHVSSKIYRQSLRAVALKQHKPACFTNIGKEKSVYKIEELDDGYYIRVCFEPVRIRTEIPAYGGVYFTFQPQMSIECAKKIVVDMQFVDRGVCSLTLELKKAKREKRDDEKKYIIRNQNTERMLYEFNLEDCPNEIKEELGEITFVTQVEDFIDENFLKTEFVIYGIQFI